MDALVPRRVNPFDVAAEAHKALVAATDPAEIRKIEISLDAVEGYMRATGLYKIDEMRPVNEERMHARWFLGRALKSVGRTQGTRTDRATLSVAQTKFGGFREYLRDIALDKSLASDAQRIGALPQDKLDDVIKEWRTREDLLTYPDLILISRPYWHQEKRADNHKRIVEEAAKARLIAPERLGPFALIYADPPWVFETHTPEMTHRMPDDHYPVLTDQEIIDVEFFGHTIEDISQENCALFMWCTSSNLERALSVMRGWGFTYKTQAVWDKEVIGMGLIFRNQHEVLLYGTRGDPPKPMHLPSSVFRYRRGKHSAKPPEIRKEIEQMYPFYGEDNRVELFARGQIKHWTSVGYEAAGESAA